MRRPFKILAALTALGLPAVAQAQSCTAAQLAANPLVGLGYHALVRINNTAFDLSCYYQNIGGGQIAFNAVSPTVSLGSGVNEIRATINQVEWTTGSAPILNYGVASTIGRIGTTPADFVFAFAAPLTATVYGDATAQIGVTRASGNPAVSPVPGGAPSTVPLGGSVPNYLVSQGTNIAVSGGGSNANPFATNLGVDVGNTACTTGTACSYPPAASTSTGFYSAWGTVVSYRQTRPMNASANAQVNGQVTLTATPEPATLALMTSGLLALGGAGYVRRRRI